MIELYNLPVVIANSTYDGWTAVVGAGQPSGAASRLYPFAP
ncbi:hypothetical protein [Chloroflexus sp.]|nr:hypothetical protein [Chloroflexus sp.]